MGKPAEGRLHGWWGSDAEVAPLEGDDRRGGEDGCHGDQDRGVCQIQSVP